MPATERVKPRPERLRPVQHKKLGKRKGGEGERVAKHTRPRQAYCHSIATVPIDCAGIDLFHNA